MVLHDIAEDAVLVEIAGPSLRADILGPVDMHMGDIVSVPQGLENEVGETEHHQVLDDLFAQVMVNAVGLRFRKDPAQFPG